MDICNVTTFMKCLLQSFNNCLNRRFKEWDHLSPVLRLLDQAIQWRNLLLAFESSACREWSHVWYRLYCPRVPPSWKHLYRQTWEASDKNDWFYKYRQVALTNLFAFRSKFCIACSMVASSSHSLPDNLSDFLKHFFSQTVTHSKIQTHPLDISSRLDLQKHRRQGNLTKVSSLMNKGDGGPYLQRG